MNKQTRSRMVSLAITSVMLGAGVPLISYAFADAQTSPAQTILTRGEKLIAQRQFGSAKKVLLSINPAQLSSADRASLVSLLQKADVGLSDQSTVNTIFENAQASLADGHLAHAVQLYRVVEASPSAPPELIREAKDNLVLAQAKQAAMLGSMQTLLAKAKAAYASGNLDQASNDLRQIQVSGVDLGSQSQAVPHYQYLIAQKRLSATMATAAVKPPAPMTPAAMKPAPMKPAPMVAEKAPVTPVNTPKPAAPMTNTSTPAVAIATPNNSQILAEQHAQAEKLAAQEAAQRAAAREHAAQVALAAQLATAEMHAETARAAMAAQMAAAEKKAAAHKLMEQKMAAEAAAKKVAMQQAAAKATQQAMAAHMAQEQQAHELLVRKEKAAEAAAEAARLKAAKPMAPAAPVAVVAVVPATKPVEEGKPMNAMPPAPAAKQVVPMAAPSGPSAAQINQQRSAALVVEADNAVHAAKYHQAIGLYNDALALDPTNSAARMGRDYAEKLAAGQSPGLLETELYSQAIAAQRSEVLFNHDIAMSTQAMSQGKYVAALDMANNALATAQAGKQLFTASDYATMKARAKSQIALVQREQMAAEAQATAQRSHEVQKSQSEIEHKIAVQRRDQIHQLMKQALAYYKRLEYQQSLDTLNQIVAIDPLNYSARFMRRQVQNQIIYNKYNSYRDQKSLQTQEQELSNEENLIPYHNLLVYPRDWPELSRLRESEQSSTESSADTMVRKRLGESVPSVSVQQQPFDDVVNLLRRETGANIVVNWNALANAGVQKQTPISLQLSNVPFKKVLSLVLQQAAGSGGTPLGYSIEQGVITISTRDSLALQQQIKIYDIADLLVQAPNFTNAPTFNLSSATQNSTSQVSSQGGGGMGNIGGGGSIFQQNSAGGPGGAQQGKSRKAMVHEITSLIENTVDRNSWVDNGGSVGTVRELNGQLVVNQTPNNQTKIAALLQKLRESRAIEISINTRFLVVSTDFLNSFGFSWNLNFNGIGTGSAFTPGTNNPANPFFGGNVAPLSVLNNTETLATPIATGVGNNIAHGFSQAGSALDVSGGILSNYQLNLLINATQESEHTTNLTAPRLTLFNGQQAFITVTQQQNFVSSFTQTAGVGGGIIGGIGGVATNLSVSTLSTGVVLEVQATVSADHRYVVMTIQPSLATLVALNTFDITGQENPANPNGIPGFVQLPIIQLTQVATTVSVPDGGTLLLGGQRLVGETEVEAGVPVLSAIPIINRLFTNRSYVRDTGVLLILVRPRIIIQKEWERKQFGRNY